MGLNGFTEWLFSALLSWMQIIYNWFWSMLATGGQNEFMPWFSDNWLTIVGALLIVGLVVDYTIYLMRWQPYHVWLTALRRARGYVSHPFAREKSRPRYAGYRRVLEGYEGERPARRPDARRPRQYDGAPIQVYEAAPRVRPQPYAPDADAVPQTYEAAVRPEPRAYEAAPNAAPQVYEAAVKAEPQVYEATVNAAPQAYEAAVKTEPQAYAPAADADAQPGGLDAEGYEPERVAADEPAGEADMFGAPPQFARAESSAPVYGVYTGRGPFMPIGMGESRPARMELPDMPPIEETVAPPPAQQPPRPAGAHSAAPGAARPAGSAPRPQRAVEGYESRRRRARAQAPGGTPQPAQPDSAPAQRTRPAQPQRAPAAQPAGAPVQAAPRSISVRKAGITRDIEFDEE